MAKKNSNSGFERQGAVMGRFRREAKAPVSQSSAVAVAIQAGKQNRAYQEEQKRKAAEAPRFSSKFLATGK
jgi:thiazole synthase ThiGH ThiG subunit